MQPTSLPHLDLQLLFLVSQNPSIDVCHLITKQHGSLPQFYASFRRIQEASLITVTGETGLCQITPAGVEKLPTQAKDAKLGSFQSKCTNCTGRGYVTSTPSFNEEKFKKLVEILKDRPAAVEEYDQWYMAPEHAVYRTDFFNQCGDLAAKKILFIGDDDLLSVATALTGLPSEVVVLEIDQRIIDFVNKTAKDHNLKLKGFRYDIRVPLTPDFAKNFDVFVCDPTETVQAFKLFVSRGVSCLKGVGSSLYFGLTALEASTKKWFEFQGLLRDMNMVITDIRHNFTEYPDPDWAQSLPIWQNLKLKPTCPWYKSCVYRLEAIDVPKPVIAGDYEFVGDVYVDDESWATTANKSEVDSSVNGSKQ